MIALPNETDLLTYVRSSLDDVANEEQKLHSPDWFFRIASAIATKVQHNGLECRARGKPPPCKENELLWDFIALIDDQDGTPDDDRFFAQAAIVGEIEWNTDDGEIDRDFEKLLYVDSLTCFMTFQKRSTEDAKEKLNWLKAAVTRRQNHARIRGLTRPPAFLLSCWVLNDHRFEHEVVCP